MLFLNLPVAVSGQREITEIFFYIFLWCLKRLYEGRKGLENKVYEGRESVKIKILVYFGTTF